MTDHEPNTGHWLGVDPKTGQYVLWDGGVIRMCRTITRLPDDDKWKQSSLAQLSATPWSIHEAKPPEVVFRERPEGQEQPERVAATARQFYMREGDFARYGYTDNCQKCQDALPYCYGATTKPHRSEEREDQ